MKGRAEGARRGDPTRASPRPTRRRGALAWALLGLLLALAACDEGAAPGEARPGSPPGEAEPLARGVVLVTIDTLRADALGAYAEEHDHSPEIDRLAAEGVLYEQAHAASPNTLPSHASILTGLHPFAHGVRSNAGYELAGRHTTLAERLREAGFATGAEVAAVVLARRTGIDQGFAHFRDPETPGVTRQNLAVRGAGEEPDGGALPLEGGARTVDLLTRPASDVTRGGIEFLRRVGERPFFLWLHYFDPHFPYAPPEALRARHADAPTTARSPRWIATSACWWTRSSSWGCGIAPCSC